MDKNKADDLNDLGISCYQQGNYSEAEKHYLQAILAYPEHKWALHNLGLLYKALKKYDLAIEYYNKSLAIDPQYSDALNGLGTAYYDLENYEQAKEYYEKTITIDSKHHFAYLNLALIYEKTKNPKKTKEFYQKAIQANPRYAKAYNGLGICFYNEKNYDEALANYKAAIKYDPNTVYPYYNIGLVHEMQKDIKNAFFWYYKALKIDPSYPSAKNGIDYLKKHFSHLHDFSVLEEEIKNSNEQDFMEEKKDFISSNKDSQSFLKQFGRNLNQLAKENKLTNAIGRDAEINGMLEILYKRIKNNPILVGHPGVGKTAIVEGFVKRIVEGQVPQSFLNKEVIELNIGSLVAGTTFRGQLEEKVKVILEEVKENPHYIIFIDEIHTMVGAGRTADGSLDIAQMLKPALARGEFPCIGATTITEYQRYFEKDAALERRFYPLRVDELSAKDTVQVLEFLKPKLEKHYQITITQENLEQVVDLCQKHIKKRYFPDKAIDIIEKTCSRASLNKKTVLLPQDIRQIVSENCGIQFMEDEKEEKSRMLQMEEYLKSKIMGQDDVIDRVSGLVRMTKSRLDLKPERPDGVFLFSGPSGVGKTELAKELAQFLFGTSKKLIKIDMGEFSESHSVAKLIGSPPGYVGYDNPSYITAQIEENPSSVLVLDEIEKAHPEILKVFLQVFDEGTLRDSRGRLIVFSDVTIIMTSNIIKELKAKKPWVLAAKIKKKFPI